MLFYVFCRMIINIRFQHSILERTFLYCCIMYFISCLVYNYSLILNFSTYFLSAYFYIVIYCFMSCVQCLLILNFCTNFLSAHFYYVVYCFMSFVERSLCLYVLQSTYIRVEEQYASADNTGMKR